MDAGVGGPGGECDADSCSGEETRPGLPDESQDWQIRFMAQL